ncbi:LysR family transcriptional regulator [Vibrio fluvialis]|uniref:LysR substrate-binding domain-containing protein n=1 Tax=Vibrio fluvialis TaxID=676 RepID=UPI001F352471|nr:LysR family transcriptional regulator [Vibrio fluvialis]MCE7617164.1 LysR family transcriptional regulator [Vibrio fluvialis]
MDRLTAMHTFVRVAELASFSRAAEELGLPKASVSNHIQLLETQAGARLLQRTTRKVSLTPDGRTYYERCLDLLAEFEELDTLFVQTEQQLSGRIRVDMPTGMAKGVVVPHLAEFLQQHPGVQLELSSTDRRVDVVREGFDFVVRAGQLSDSALIARKVCDMAVRTYASPGYLARHGEPKTPVDLSHHQLVHYAQNLGGQPDGWEYWDGERLHTIDMAGALTVNNAESYTAACLAGIGLIQTPESGVRKLVASGQLVEVLANYTCQPLPVYLLYPHRRHLAKRVRVLMDWMTVLIQRKLQSVHDELVRDVPVHEE